MDIIKCDTARGIRCQGYLQTVLDTGEYLVLMCSTCGRVQYEDHVDKPEDT